MLLNLFLLRQLLRGFIADRSRGETHQLVLKERGYFGGHRTCFFLRSMESEGTLMLEIGPHIGR